jgi:hypothetical protein
MGEANLMLSGYSVWIMVSFLTAGAWSMVGLLESWCEGAQMFVSGTDSLVSHGGKLGFIIHEFALQKPIVSKNMMAVLRFS